MSYSKKRIVIAALVVCLFCCLPMMSQDIGGGLFGEAPATPDAPPRTTEPMGQGDLQGFTAEPQSSGNDILIEDCTIEHRAMFTLSAEESGRLLMGPELGAEVKEGELVAKTDDTLARHQHRVAYFGYQAEKTKTESDIDGRYADKNAQVKEAAYQNAEAANAKVKNAVTPEVLRQKKFEHEGAVLGIEKAEHDMLVTTAGAEVKLAEFEAAEAMLSRHQIKAPATGIVQEVHRRKGEWVTPGDPIAELVQMDRLRVHGHVSIRDCAPGDARGAAVIIEIPSSRDEEGKPTAFTKIESKIMHVELKVDSGTDTYLIYAEFPNTPDMDYWPNTPDVSMRLQLK